MVQNDTPREGGNDDGDEWDPEPADLRDGETPDEDSHAARNARMIREARRELNYSGPTDIDETPAECNKCGRSGIREDFLNDGGSLLCLNCFHSDDPDEGGSLNEAAIREQLDDAEDDIREFAEEEF